jgi:hypothetical protein
MPQWRSIRVSALTCTFVVGSLTCGSQSALATTVRARKARACASSFAKARGHERAGALRQAATAFSRCAAAGCGEFLRHECWAGIARMAVETPSIVPTVTTDSGARPQDVSWSMDGTPMSPWVEGQPISADPGLHEFTFRTGDGLLATRRVLLVQGQRDHPLAVVMGSTRRSASESGPVLERTKESAPIPGERSSPDTTSEGQREASPAGGTKGKSGSTSLPIAGRLVSAESIQASATSSAESSGALPYVLTGVGILGVGGYGVLTYLGRKDNQGMVSACPPDCSQSRVTHIRRLYFAADVSLALGVAAIGTSVWLFLTRPSDHPRNPSAYTLGLSGAPAGAIATFSGAL